MLKKHWRILLILLLSFVVLTLSFQLGQNAHAQTAPTPTRTYRIILVPTVTPTPDNRPRSADGILLFQLPNAGQICISNSAEQIKSNFPGTTHVSFETIKSDTLEGTGIERKASIEAVTGQHRECSEIPGTWEDGVRIKVMNGDTILASGNLLKVHDKRNKDIVVVDFNLLNLK